VAKGPRRMRIATTMLIAAAAAISLLAASWLDGRGEGPTAGPQPLLSAEELPIERIDEIEIRRGDAAWRLLREEGVWRQASPFPHPIDAAAARRMIVAAESLRSSRTLAASALPRGGDGEIVEVGLDPPLAEVAFRWSEGDRRQELAIDLGRRSVAGRAWLRRRGEDAIHAASSELHDRLLADDPRNWRSRSLFEADRPEPDAIRLLVGGSEVRLERQGRSWRLLEPVATRLDRDSVQQWLDAIRRAESSGFFEDEPTELGRYGLAGDADEIRLERRVGDAIESEAVRIGGAIGPGSSDRFAIVEGRPAVVLLGEGVRAALLRPVVSLIDASGSGVRPEDVRSVEIRTDAETFLLQRTLEGFVASRLGEGGEVVAEAPAIREVAESLLGSLCLARAPEIAVQAFPHEIGVGVAILRGFDGAPLDAVRIAREPESGRYALENGDSVLRIFPASLALPLAGREHGLPPLDG
jgi:hypothetical protein